MGLPLRFGASDAVLEMTRRVAQREGFGDVLAEGAKRAAATIGSGAERYAMHVKGIEMVPFEPRTQTMLALGYATAAVGPRYEICEHDWDYDVNVGWPHAMDNSRALGILERIPMGELSERKVRYYRVLNTVWSAADALGICLFAAAPTRALTLEEMAQLLAAVTGWETSSYELMAFGERRNQLMRLYNVREGLTAADDTLPDRFFEDPIPDGAWTGVTLDRARVPAPDPNLLPPDGLGRPGPAHPRGLDRQRRSRLPRPRRLIQFLFLFPTGERRGQRVAERRRGCRPTHAAAPRASGPSEALAGAWSQPRPKSGSLCMFQERRRRRE